MDGASNLFERAAGLLGEGDRARIELEVGLGDALLESGRLIEAESLLERTARLAACTGDRLSQARAQVGLAAVRIQTRGARDHAQIRSDVEPLVSVFEEAEDHRGAAGALALLGKLSSWANDCEAASDLQERALLHARSAGDDRREAATIRYIVSDALWGPEHVEPALARCRAILDGTSNRPIQAHCLIRIGGLEGLAGRFGAARAAIEDARAIMDDLGLRHLRAHSTDVVVFVEMLAGDYPAAEREARAAYAVLDEMGDRTYQVAEAFLIGKALEAQGRVDEAERWLATAEGLGGASDDPGDLDLRARIMFRRARLVEAERLARSELAQSGESPVPSFADPRFTLAEILTLMGRGVEARVEVESCLRRYEAKGIVPLMDRARALLVEIPL